MSQNYSIVPFVLLLTGCVKPNCDDVLKLTDIEERKKQYIDSIYWYLKNTDCNIVFCENSGTDISDAFDLDYVDRLEFVTFTSENGFHNRSKSYKEMEIIDYAFRHSCFLKEQAVYVKITGRLKYLNIKKTICYLEKKINDCSKEYVCCDLGKTNIWSDSRFFFCTQPFIERLLSKMDKIDLEFEFERALGTCVFQGLKEDLTFIYPNEPQRVSGIGGGFGIVYDEPDKSFLKRKLKHVIY